MARACALLGIALAAASFRVCPADAGDGPAGLEVKYRYLVVDVVGPPEWVKQHSFSVQWQGKAVPLPVVFRVPGPAEDFEMQSGGETSGRLRIGRERVPVAAKPQTKFQVRNTGVLAVIGEKSPRKDVAAVSIATAVAVSPPEQPGEGDPNAEPGKVASAGQKWSKRLNELVAAGRVIDLAPGRTAPAPR